MKNFALAMVAVLAMATVSMAGTSISVVDMGIVAGPAGPDVLHQYQVLVGGTKTILGTMVDGEVYNCSERTGIGGTVRVPYIYNDIIGTYEGYQCKEADTHFLINTPGSSLGVLTDTDDNLNTAGVDTVGGFIHSGWGVFTGDAAFGMTLPAVLQENTPFLQVVLREGGTAMMNCILVDPVSGSEDAYSVPLGGVVPEPGTIMLLLAGAACLLGIRRR